MKATQLKVSPKGPVMEGVGQSLGFYLKNFILELVLTRIKGNFGNIAKGNKILLPMSISTMLQIPHLPKLCFLMIEKSVRVARG